MVWEVKSQSVPQRVQEVQAQSSGKDETFDLLKCNEHLPSSPGYPSNESHMEYDDLPELQEVQDDQSTPGVFQVAPGVSHEEGPGDEWSSRTESSISHTNWLTELANIATSPQSPLFQNGPHNRSSVHIFSSSSSLHSYARPPLSSRSTHSPARSDMRERRCTRASSESESGIFCMSSLSDDDDLGWSHSWPSTAWHCFLKGTRLRFHKGVNVEWQEAEDVLDSDEDSDDEGGTQSNPIKNFGSEGLKLIAFEETVSFGHSVLKLTFDPGSPEAGLLTAECRLDHPFFVKNKGWSSFYPSLTVVQHGIPCYYVQVGDLCLPPGHRDAINCDDSVVFDTFRSYDFTPLDSSAVYVLSSMARQRRASQSSGGAVSPDCDKLEACGSSDQSPSSKSQRSHASGSSGATPTKCKRPMNAFMLFAKKYRVEYTQMYPGKDNRAISVILGDKWKKMKNEERRMYTMEAKALAEEQKRLNPDCWKRKRTNSGSQQN
ncbi:HMG box-containing protein 1-like [Myxocyprinus asiaticus]|uniref:HMG box-containing protein 1-like n=1 Tax=Myxocyprinus asiaticus TaxID=70543 RepID=UPI0022231F5C|nr:HMG box-containing protein 1-like [Myxocyprinus asiaticus]XP_051548656.1 HMG box-containing protein 1-like [Myxocyprinus asiaticus]